MAFVVRPPAVGTETICFDRIPRLSGSLATCVPVMGFWGNQVQADLSRELDAATFRMESVFAACPTEIGTSVRGASKKRDASCSA